VTDAIRYFLSEAAASLWRRRRASTVAVLTIAAAMVVPGAFGIAAGNAGVILDRWRDSAEMSIFLRDEVTDAEMAALERLVDAGGLASRRAYVSKGEALRRFRNDFPDLGAAAASLDRNPLPASIEVGLVADRASPAALDGLVAQLMPMPGVADIRLDRGWMARAAALVRLATALGLMVATLLAIAAALTVANVVRLATIARRQEIEIMQLVGAPALYVRGPFVAEGVLQGGLGALVAVLLLWIGVLILQLRYQAVLGGVLGLTQLSFQPLVAAGLVAGGMLIGCLGGLAAARGVRTL
jgi:cell division transport system permease protein